MRGGNATQALATLNTLRTQTVGGVAGLAPLTDPGTENARVDLLMRERAFWMFGTGHRLGDLRRLVRQYNRPLESVYPTGAYHKAGGRYGAMAVLPVSFDERNNPNFQGCTDLRP
ncbi:MAG: RagB/SusD family nutrient uptake outer membrane protein [Gemmatimonadaceae bacterium]|nr:RagB/SusD family nutrient uptake outer membrane protein [Gemmatimonadaceae bacterium]